MHPLVAALDNLYHGLFGGEPHPAAQTVGGPPAPAVHANFQPMGQEPTAPPVGIHADHALGMLPLLSVLQANQQTMQANPAPTPGVTAPMQHLQPLPYMQQLPMPPVNNQQGY